MTGKYETELAEIANASAWAIPKLEELKIALAQLQKNMNTIAGSPGWTGASAESASEMFSALKTDFAAAETAVAHIHEALSLANTAKTAAAEAYHQLPGVSVPNDIRSAIDKGAATVSVAYLSPFPIAADKVFDMALDFFGNQREDQAKAALQTLQSHLQEPSSLLAAQNSELDPGARADKSGNAVIIPDPAPAHISTPSNYYRGSAGGLGGSSSAPNGSLPTTEPGSNLPVFPSVPSLPSGPSVDGGLDGGTVPGSGTGSGSGSGLGSGQGVGGIGVGVGGSAAAAAGLAVASRLGGGIGAAGGLGSASPLGSGGLLGSGKAGAGSAAEEGAGGAGAGKPGTSMMGQGGGGGSRNKDKRAGLGGIIAPKLDDEEEVGPRSSRAMAGGRDTTTGK